MSELVKLSHPPTKGFWEIPVLYEDEALLVLDKPSNMHTSPGEGASDLPDMMALLHKAIQEGKPWAAARKLTYLRNAHRVDFGASGVLILAKSEAILAVVANAFGSEKTSRRYVALVQGASEQDQFEVDAKLAPHAEDPGLMRVDSRHGKKSKTRFAVKERFRGWMLLDCEPQPDRPHQLRVHLRHIRLPVAGDPLYRGGALMLSSIKPGFRLKPHQTERPLMVRPAVHLEEITLAHPITGAPTRFAAPWAKDLTVALKYLRKYAMS